MAKQINQFTLCIDVYVKIPPSQLDAGCSALTLNFV